MKTNIPMIALVAGAIMTSSAAQAQIFQYSDRDLLFEVRKSGGQHDLTINLGSIDFFKALPENVEFQINPTTRPDNSYRVTEDLLGTFGSVNDLTFSIIGTKNLTSPSQPPRNTSWITQPRLDVNTKSDTPNNVGNTTLSQIRSAIAGIAGDGATSGATDYAGTVQASTTAPTLNTPDTLNIPNTDVNSYTVKRLNLANVLPTSFENNTALNFSGSGGIVRSDIYEYVPGQSGNPTAYMGYFTFYSDGTLSFTHELTPIPEPGTYAAVFAAGLLAWAGWRRHSRARPV